MIDLKVNTNLARLIQPSKTISADLDYCIIDSWNGFILTDHLLLKTAKANATPIRLVTHNFADINEAACFVCHEQLLRRDLTIEYRKFIIGEIFRYTMTENDRKNELADKIGKTQKMSGGTVLKYYVYSSALNIIFDHNEDFARDILLGKIRVSHENVVELSRLAPEEIRMVSVEVLEEGIKHLTFQEIRHAVKTHYSQANKRVQRREQRQRQNKSSSGAEAGIRQMPEYDPDSDIKSLCLTISSWVTSIERVEHSVNFSKISSTSKLDLMKQLTILERTISTLEKLLTERTGYDSGIR